MLKIQVIWRPVRFNLLDNRPHFPLSHLLHLKASSFPHHARLPFLFLQIFLLAFLFTILRSYRNIKSAAIFKWKVFKIICKVESGANLKWKTYFFDFSFSISRCRLGCFPKSPFFPSRYILFFFLLPITWLRHQLVK